MSDVLVCPACGTTIEGEKKYCPECGVPLDVNAPRTAFAADEANRSIPPYTNSNPSMNANLNQNSNFGIPPIPPVYPGTNSGSGFQSGPIPPYQNQPYMNSPYQNPMYTNMGMQPIQNDGGSAGCAIAGMVLGIISIVLCCLNWITMIIGGVGLVLSILGLKSYKFKGAAIAGMVCSICGTLLGMVEMLYYFVD